jgi:hypothetical protein
VKPLFAYGTFRRPSWRRRLLGADYPARDATLPGWRRIALASGYLSLRRSRGAAVDGIVVALDALGWRIADAWEEVPRYARVPVEVRAGGETIAAETYVCEDAAAIGDVDPARDALLPDEAVERAIAAFESAMRRLRAAAPMSG